MTSKIRILNEHTINKMAAGEVVENPSSAVKELAENALDAKASHIYIEITEGGRTLIRISDDGIGMSTDDALLCLERHATSKIREVEDIENLCTMGFRGEAIPSIAAVSICSILTCPRPEEGQKHENGSLILIEGGRILSCSTASRSPGTTIEVKSLFYNVPVRRKFQKSPTIDIQEIVKLTSQLALAHPTVHFELVSDGKVLLKSPVVSSSLSFNDLLARRLESLFGEDYTRSLLPVNFQYNSYDLQGFISEPTTHKPNRVGQHLFINQRLIHSPFISAVVREGYSSMLPNHRYPIFVIHLKMPGILFDVNVHPQKKEVRLRQEQQLKETILNAVQSALCRETQSFGSHLVITPTSSTEVSVPPFWTPYASLLMKSSTPPASEEKWQFVHTEPKIPSVHETFVQYEEKVQTSSPSIGSIHSVDDSPVIDPNAAILPSFPFLQTSQPRILATIVDYCLIDPYSFDPKLFSNAVAIKEGGVVLLNQRAASMRVYYEQLIKKSITDESQSLVVPITLQMTVEETQTIKEYLSFFNEMGFGLREFGDNIFAIDAIPCFLQGEKVHTCMNAILRDLIEMQSSRRLHLQKEERLALAASRVALPTNTRLSIEEAQALIQQLLKCDMPAQCPLGKPTYYYLSAKEIAKLFKDS